MVARVDRVDCDDREMGEVLALAQRKARGLGRFADDIGVEDVAQAELVDRDERETARRERIAEDGVDPGGDPRRPAGDFGEDEVAGLRILEVADRKLAPLALVDRGQPEARSLLPNHAKHQLGRALEFLHHMADDPGAFLLGPGEQSIADAERAAATLDQADFGGWGFGMPLFGHAPGIAAIIDIGDAQHRHLGHPAHLVERAAGRRIDQALVGHVLEQRLERDFLIALEAEGAGDLALARRDIGRGDEIEDLLAGRKTRGVFAGHLNSSLRGAKRRSNPAQQENWIASPGPSPGSQ